MYNSLVRLVNVTTGLVSTLAGNRNGGQANPGHADGVGTLASFNSPTGIAVDGAGTFAVVVSAT